MIWDRGLEGGHLGVGEEDGDVEVGRGGAKRRRR
jgi:hypothetical protein